MKPVIAMRTAVIVIFRLALFVAGCSLAYLLFIFGHTELAPLSRILTVALVAGASALVAGLLQWVGLPAERDETGGKKAGKKRGTSRSH